MTDLLDAAAGFVWRTARLIDQLELQLEELEASASEEASEEATPVEMTSVDFRLNWVIAGNHAPFFLAKQEGFWEDCGLDVTMAVNISAVSTSWPAIGSSSVIPVDSPAVPKAENASKARATKALMRLRLAAVIQRRRCWPAWPGGWSMR